ncbi:hypothetical protein AcW1_005934 [Taiwanofungus camphoratus]|nr:hypothetical protein AcW1_005934 [Antrodia cinnamomea]
MSSDALLEELEVLESIYPTELTKLSERVVRIEIDPEDPIEGEDGLKLALDVQYPDEYPEVLPDLSLETLEGSIDEEEIEHLLDELRRMGEENLGMAMTFTLVSHLREQLSALVTSRIERRKKEETERERQALQAEETRTRGTPVTIQNFMTWKAKFDKEMAAKRAREEEEKLKGLSPKEREEYKKFATRLTGRQLFERDKNFGISDDSMVEEGVISVDVSQYERLVIEEDEEAQMTFSDSD